MKGAILIIGSLLWDADKNNDLGSRKKWRDRRLIATDKIHIKVPIRYGRLSGITDEKNYTMVFSKNCEKENLFGTAYLIPLKRQNIKTYKGIENQARFLSDAEGGANDKLCKGDNKKWATIGLLLNPQLPSDKKNVILEWWSDLLKKDGGLLDYQDYKIGDEETIISNQGELLIEWIKPVNKNDTEKVNEFDFVLATCTKPTNYPSINELTLKVLIDKRKYFFSNIKNGITTFQDRDILNEQ